LREKKRRGGKKELTSFSSLVMRGEMQRKEKDTLISAREGESKVILQGREVGTCLHEGRELYSMGGMAGNKLSLSSPFKTLKRRVSHFPFLEEKGVLEKGEGTRRSLLVLGKRERKKGYFDHHRRKRGRKTHLKMESSLLHGLSPERKRKKERSGVNPLFCVLKDEMMEGKKKKEGENRRKTLLAVSKKGRRERECIQIKPLSSK